MLKGLTKASIRLGPRLLLVFPDGVEAMVFADKSYGYKRPVGVEVTDEEIFPRILKRLDEMGLHYTARPTRRQESAGEFQEDDSIVPSIWFGLPAGTDLTDIAAILRIVDEKKAAKEK
jgi:hypothetical protein